MNPWLLYFLCWIPAGLLWTHHRGGVNLNDYEEVVTLLVMMALNPFYLPGYAVYRMGQGLGWCFNLAVRG
jgi:hypothetical protein